MLGFTPYAVMLLSETQITYTLGGNMRRKYRHILIVGQNMVNNVSNSGRKTIQTRLITNNTNGKYKLKL